ncbi:MAG: GlsB/YeaQ/YmgE family stress response membrane protein [Moraxellaceae bacterium]|nr:MAG: GlsB/YeaQ/YmgE family stress response membrane protein [Moraxellaceae bacterium]
MFSLIGAIIIGFFAGLIARAIHPGNDKAGFIVTTVLGVIGALVATYLGRWLGWYADGEAAGFIMSVVGAVIVLFIYNLIMRSRHRV